MAVYNKIPYQPVKYLLPDGSVVDSLTEDANVLSGPDEELAELYNSLPYIPAKYLLSDGSVVAVPPVEISGGSGSGAGAESIELEDDEEYVLDEVTNVAFGVLVVGDDEERAVFTVNSTGNVFLMFNSLNIVANADTDNKFCIGTSVVSPIVLKNRLGSSKIITLILFSN